MATEATYIATCPKCGNVIGIARQSIAVHYWEIWDRQGLVVKRVEGEIDWIVQKTSSADCFRLGHIPNLAANQT